MIRFGLVIFLASSLSWATEVSPDLLRPMDSAICAISGHDHKHANGGCDGDCRIDPMYVSIQLQQCVQMICRDSEFAPQSTDQYLEDLVKKTKVTKKFLEQVQPEIEAYYQRFIENQKSMIEDARAYLQEDGEGEANAYKRNLEFFNANVDHIVFEYGKDEKIVIAERKSRRNMKDLSEAQQDWLIEFVQYNLENGGPDLGIGGIAESPTYHLLERYSVKDTNLALRKALEEINRLKQEIPELKYWPNLSSRLGPLNYYSTQIESGRTLSEEELNGLVYNLKDLELRKQAVNDPEYRNLIENKRVTEGQSWKPSQSEQQMFYVNSAKIMQQIESKPLMERNKARFVDRCFNSFVVHMESLPTETQLTNFKASLGDYKTHYKNFLKDIVSKESLELFNKGIDEAEFAYPESQEEFSRSLQERLRLMTEQAIPEGNSTATIQTIASLQEADLFLGDSSMICSFGTETSFYDHVFTDSGEIKVSALSVTTEKSGHTIANHELGHVVSATLRSRGLSLDTRVWAKDVQKCLMNKHQRRVPFGMNLKSLLTRGKTIKISKNQFLEEDFGDLIAATVSKDKGENWLCAMNINPALEYIGPGDHSTNLFRMLHHEHVSKGKLPEICDIAMASMGDVRDFSSCLEPEKSAR